mmetsp:Transcript_5686/g.12332  ORF Transcript_5686/g.12332 Transcript_5686/m.12332 type:complete len:235 (+) Transcript_5686:702-1406(+)
MPPSPPLVLLIKKIRHPPPRLLRRRLRIRYHILRIHPHTRILGHVLPHIPILRVRCEKCHVQKERLILRTGYQKPQGIRLVLLGDVPYFLPQFAIMPSVVLHVEIYILIEWQVHAPLSGVPHVIPIPRQYFVKTQLLPILGHLLQLLFRLFYSTPTTRFLRLVTGHVLPGVEGGATYPAYRCGDAVVGEAHSVGGEGVEDGSLEYFVDGFDGVVGGEGVVRPVVGVEEEDVHSG